MERTFQYLSGSISYTIAGEGKTVILLHGFGEDRNVWKYQAPFLEKHCRLIVPDLPGSGRSTMLGPEPGVRSPEVVNDIENTPVSRLQASDYISITDYADCIHALLQHENIDQCIMLGHSMGGYITLAFAEKYPSMLSAFGLIHSTAYADSEEKKTNREKGIAMMEEYGSYAFLKNTTPNLFSKKFKQEHPDKIAGLIGAGAGFQKEALQQYYRAMMLRPDRTSVLSSNRLPVLFVIGTEDVAAPMADMLKQAALPDISYIHVLQNTGHMGMWETPELLKQHILAFIDHPS